jgi:hypothetical protein
MNIDILAKLQRHRGYQGWRVRPYSLNPPRWLAETYGPIGRGTKKGWRSLWDEKRGDYRTFPTPDLAYAALLALQKELDDLASQFGSA